MKKIALLLTVVILGTAAFAAAPVAAAATASPAVGKLAIGTWGGMAIAQYQFNNDLSGGIGLTLNTGTVSNTTLLGKIDYNLAKADMLQPTIGIYYTSVANVSTIGLDYGVSTMLLSNLSIGFDVLLISNSAGTTSILPGATFKAAYYL